MVIAKKIDLYFHYMCIMIKFNKHNDYEITRKI